MSNHSGSYMLNDVMEILEREQVFELLGRKRTQRVVLAMTAPAAKEYDCNESEILMGYGQKLGLCYVCMKPATNVKEDICQKCRIERGCPDDDPLYGMRLL